MQGNVFSYFTLTRKHEKALTGNNTGSMGAHKTMFAQRFLACPRTSQLHENNYVNFNMSISSDIFACLSTFKSTLSDLRPVKELRPVAEIRL